MDPKTKIIIVSEKNKMLWCLQESHLKYNNRTQLRVKSTLMEMSQ
jgi:L,D-peptidoglycan transpeptidase YkuD (ErfK/YbiS/YcfS/YnhG family)